MRNVWSVEAETTFRDFARRHSLTIEKIDDAPVELLMLLPTQPGLSFELTLGLQNSDELNIGFEGFWSYFFPYEKSIATVVSVVEGILSGDCRLATHRQFGFVLKRVLERRVDQSWERVYTHYSLPRIPMIKSEISYLYNQDIHQKGMS